MQWNAQTVYAIVTVRTSKMHGFILPRKYAFGVCFLLVLVTMDRSVTARPFQVVVATVVTT